MRRSAFMFAATVLVLAVIALTKSFAATAPFDPTQSKALPRYVPTAADLAYQGTTVGDVAEADVYAVGTALQYTGLVLDGDGVNANGSFPFLKVQTDSGISSFDFAACYVGNNGSAFGLGFFALSQPFSSAHMRASRSGSTVTIEFTNVNGGTLQNQTYVCSGAPTPPGNKIGVVGYANNTAQLDNFSDGSTVLDTFSFVGPLGATGNWNDAAPGMNADGSRATGGPTALSFWIGTTGGPLPTLTKLRPKSGAQGKTMNVRMTGTNFVSGSTSVQVSGDGITVGAVTVASSTNLTAKFSIDPAAAVGARNVTVTTPNGVSNALLFNVRQPFGSGACPASLPLSVAGSRGNLNITAGIGTSEPTAGSWVAGWMVFNSRSVSFSGASLYSGALPAANLTRSLSANVAPVPVIGVLNAFYNPYLCGYTIAWASTSSLGTPSAPVTSDQLDVLVNSLDLEDFNGPPTEIPR